MGDASFDLATGRIVHVVRYIEGVPAYAGCRPAMVVREWGNGTFNGHIFLDGPNDTDNGDLVRWVTSVSHVSHQDGDHARYEWHSHLECSALHNRGAL